MSDLEYYPLFIYRCPTLPVRSERSEAFFKESVYLASLSLFQEYEKIANGQILKWKDHLRISSSLKKYDLRMRTRCTPFGLFAGIGVGIWGKSSKIVLDGSIQRKVRLDMGVLCSISVFISRHPSAIPFLKYYPNTSIYFISNEIRYVEYPLGRQNKFSRLASVELNDYLIKILEISENGASFQELVSYFDQSNISNISEYILQLIDAQILVNQLELTLSGEEYEQVILRELKVIGSKAKNDEINNLYLCLKKSLQLLSELDDDSYSNVRRFQEVSRMLKDLKFLSNERYLFHVDSNITAIKAELSDNIKPKILNVIKILTRLYPVRVNSNLKLFKEKYRDVYDRQEMSILQVLDTELGIGYPVRNDAGTSPLIDDIKIKGRDSRTLDWNKTEEFLFSKLIECYENNLYTLCLSEEEILKEFPEEKKLPDSFLAKFNIVDNQKQKVVFSHAGGASATSILGRFGFVNKDILRLLLDISSHEENLNPDKLIAEIIHFPEARVANILFRPNIRKYEIPYLAKSSVPSFCQVSLRDIFIKIHGDRIVLWSRKLNKEIIPRLGNAHAWSKNALPVYHFLCDLQFQNTQAYIRFDWGSLANKFTFLPRVELNGVIIHKATWQLKRTKFDHFFKSPDNLMEAMDSFRLLNKIPKKIYLFQNDNELFIDLSDIEQIKILIDLIKGDLVVILKEYIDEPENKLVVNVKNEGFLHECVAVIKNKRVNRPITCEFESDSKAIQRTFLPGSKWLYFKVYTGTNTSDKILVNLVAPLIGKLKTRGYIDCWFFVRFSDPDHHIRIRIHINNNSAFNKVRSFFNRDLFPYVKNFTIKKIVTDTYVREIERYGKFTVKIAEKIFSIDSDSTLEFFKLINSDTRHQLKYDFAFLSIHYFLNDIGYTNEPKLELMRKLSNAYLEEHGRTKELILQLDTKYRQMKRDLGELLEQKRNDEDSLILNSILSNKSKEQKSLILELTKKIKKQNDLKEEQIVGDLIHMMMNRLFNTRSRTHELVVYTLLHQYYLSQKMRLRYLKINLEK